MKRTRAGEMWEVWDGFGNTDYQEVLVIDTTVISFEERSHLCLNLHTGAFTREIERMDAIWESTPIQRVASSSPLRFDATLHRRRVM